MEDILFTAGLVASIACCVTRICLFRPNKAWLKNVLLLVVNWIVAWAFFDFSPILAVICAASETVLSHLLSVWIYRDEVRKRHRVEAELTRVRTEQNLQFIAGLEKISTDKPNGEEVTPVGFKSVSGHKVVKQTLHTCVKCGALLSNELCASCGLDHTQVKVSFLLRIDPRRLQISNQDDGLQ